MREICLTIAGTVVSGVIVFVLSQVFLEFFIKPRVELSKLKARILYTLVLYADVISNPFVIHSIKVEEDFKQFKNSFYSDASAELRKLGSELSIYHKKKMKSAVANLIGLSNGLWIYDTNTSDRGQENRQMSDEIKKAII